MIQALILGHKGMLGNAVLKYFESQSSKEIISEVTENRWPTDKFKREILEFKGDFIINCIAKIPNREGILSSCGLATILTPFDESLSTNSG